MKKFLWIITTLAVVAAACLVSLVCFAKPLLGKHIIKASGNIITKEIPIPEFNAINTSRAVKSSSRSRATRSASKPTTT